MPAPTLVGSNGAILIVDDDEAMCQTLSVCLVRRGFVAKWRTSAREALALIDEEDFDVIFTDLNMDDMDGIALCERVHVLRPGLPVIIATGFGTADIKSAAMGAGAHEFLTKPIDLDRLRVSLLAAVSCGRAARVRPITH